ncbi:type II secretion system protein [Rheinheimera sp.]|uniref:type II secretion system protein n=1 Tax=Rheinheimera sp. TaxID=1869214 RepID=UPI0027B8CEEB|nr:type II secretion system protein [Rheinheimera sp.]
MHSQPLQSRHISRSFGVTLVELIVVMLLLSILAVGVTTYVRLGAGMYMDANAVQQVLQQSRFALERVVREVRGAVPGSVRVAATADNSVSCVEFAPLAQSGIYRDLPLYPDRRNWIGVTSLNTGWTAQPGQRLTVYPTDASHIYALNQGRSADVATVQNAPDDADGKAHTSRISLADIGAQPASFVTESPQRRFYLAAQPVSICRVGAELRRYSNYGFLVAQPLPPLVNSDLLAVGLNNSSSEAVFSYSGATLNRGAMLHLFWRFSPVASQGQDLFFNHEVHIPNVP